MDGAQQAPRLTQVLDEKAQEAFVDFFRGLPSDGTIRLFQRAAARPYYSCHGPDAELLRTWYLRFSLEVVPLGQAQPLPSTSFNQQTYEEMVTDLLVHRGRKVELWCTDAEKKSNTWRCVKRGSPGNMQQFEDVVATERVRDAPVVMAVTFAQEAGRVKFGCAYCNPTLRALGVAEFLDADQFLNLETFIIQVGAKECLVLPAGKEPSLEERQVRDVLQRATVVCTEVKKADFAQKDVPGDLQQLLADSVAVMADLELRLALQSMGALLKFLDLLADDSNAHQFQLKREDLKRFLRMDTAALAALHVFPADPQSAATATASLYGLLNRCHTAMGQRTLKQWLAQPLMDVAEIRKRQDMVEAFMDDVLFCSSIREDILRHVPDLDAVLRKLQRRKARLEDAVGLGRFLQCIPRLVEALRHYGGPHRELLQADLLQPLQEIASYFENLTCLIDNTLDTTGPEPLIQASFDDDLEELAQQRRRVEHDINKEYKRMLKDLDVTDKVCKVDRNTQQGFFWKVTRTAGNQLQDLGKAGYEVIVTNKSGTQFTNAELKRLNRDYSSLVKAYQGRQGELEQKFLETVASYAPVLEDVKHYLTSLDLYTCFATVALNAPTPFVRPRVLGPEDGERHFVLKAARHPMLEVQEGVAFIPNDYELDGNHNMSIITGPNMGGKSTYIRTAGVIQLMAQVGLPVPCAAATVSVCDSILARVGATDYQVRGVSTFMAEMLETSTILSNASDRSFVIVDELGRGTSTYDGFGLAWAICESIACELGSFCLFATHFHELTHMAAEHSNVRNFHVTADTSRDHIMMLYQIQGGPCEKSFGIHVAELARFPDDIVQCAKRKAAELEDFRAGPGHRKRRALGDPRAVARVDELLREFAAEPLPVDVDHWRTRLGQLASSGLDLQDLLQLSA
eukprot:EG_transcript_2281